MSSMRTFDFLHRITWCGLSIVAWKKMNMKVLATFTLVLTSSTLWSQSALPAWAQDKFRTFASKYVMSDYIKPQFLEADLSGDKKSDIALFVERKVDRKKGILIFFEGGDKSFVVGAGDEFGKAGRDFEWARTWIIIREKTTFETTFKANGDVAGTKEIKLEHPAIEITEEEGAGGLIYFNGKEFIWIHQGD